MLAQLTTGEQSEPRRGEQVTVFHRHNTESSGGAQPQARCPGITPPGMSPGQPHQVSCKCHITLGKPLG